MITGGAGFIGLHLAHGLVDEGYYVVLLANMARCKTKYINDIVSKGRATFVTRAISCELHTKRRFGRTRK